MCSLGNSWLRSQDRSHCLLLALISPFINLLLVKSKFCDFMLQLILACVRNAVIFKIRHKDFLLRPSSFVLRHAQGTPPGF